MKTLRKRLSFSNVISLIALFAALGGSAYAALGANSVGSKQLKRGAVRTADIRNGAVSTAKLKNGAVTGAKVNLATLGTVPSANTANTADAANAVDGQSVTRIFTTLQEGSPSNATIATVAGFELEGECDIDDVDLTWRSPPTGGADVQTSSFQASTVVTEEDHTSTGDASVDVDQTTGNDYGQTMVSGVTAGGAVVNGVIAYDWDIMGSTTNCVISGHLISG